MCLLRFYTIILLSWTCTSLYGQKDYRIRNLKFEGNEILSDNELLAQFNTQPEKQLEKIFFWKKNPDLILSVLQEDTVRLRSYYNRNGFLTPEIDLELDTSGFRRLIKITIKIIENDFVRVDSVKLDPGLEKVGARLLDSIRPKLPFKPGQRFSDDKVFATQIMLEKTFSDHGYPFTEVDYEIGLKDENRMADVDFRIYPGNRFFFGKTEITGDTAVPEGFIKKYFRFSEGELYSQEEIDKTQQALFETELFQYVVITSLKDSVQKDRIPIEIMLKELPRWNLETGFGYGSEDRLRLSGQLTKLNFLGGARRLVINAKTSYFNPFGFEFKFIQPDIFAPNLDFVFNPFYSRERELSYSYDRYGGGISFLYRLGRNISANITYSFERVLINEFQDLEPEEPQMKYNKSIINLGSQLNSTDDRFYPSKGYRIGANISLAGIGFRTELPYFKAELSLINYFPLAKDLVLATKIRTGSIQPTRTGRQTPLEERFFLGGASSLRGWGRHDIYPVSLSEFVTGGNTMIEGSAELRFPIYEILQGVLFIEAGNVWSDPWFYDLGLLHYNAGTGLRIRSPIGPIRLDFATPIINDDPAFQFFISVGHTF